MESSHSLGIGEERSLTLLRNVVRTAVSTVAAERGLFPSSCFRDVSIDGALIRTLVPIREDVRLLINWLERGVFDALQKKYLQSLSLEIHAGSPEAGSKRRLLERYSFAFEYGSHQSHSTYAGCASPELSQPPSTQQLKTGTSTLLSHLLEVATTLPKLPNKRVISFRLQYHDGDTPEDYQPPFFAQADLEGPPIDQVVEQWVSIPVATGHHTLSVAVSVDEGRLQEQLANTTAEPHDPHGLDPLLDLVKSPPPAQKTSPAEPSADSEGHQCLASQRPMRKRRPPCRLIDESEKLHEQAAKKLRTMR